MSDAEVTVVAASGEQAGAVLRVEDLTVERGARPVVHAVSLEVTPGEVTALLGPNGAGKSSLVLAVGGVLRAAGGKVTLGANDLTSRRPERIRQAGVAIVPEGRRLLPLLTVRENLGVATYSLSRSDAKAGLKRALELFPELEKRLDVLGRLLSGGEQQMLVLAQALVSRPKFVFIDELSLGLAPVVVQRLLPTIREVAEGGVGVLLDRAVRHRGAQPRRARVHHGGRPNPVLGDGQRAQGEPRPAPLGLSAARQRRAERRACLGGRPAARDRGLKARNLGG